MARKSRSVNGNGEAGTKPASPEQLRCAALWYAGYGLKVFPVNGRTKRPITKNGFHDASADRDQVEAWWKEHPDAAIGTPSLDAIDVDLYKPESAETWKEIKPLIPGWTPSNKTGGGGLQFLFAPGTLRDGKIGPGVDNRYAGRNYIILPPSPHPSGGRYEVLIGLWEKRPQPAPDFPHLGNGGGSEFQELRAQIDAGDKITDGRNKATWWQAVKVLRALPPATDLAAVQELVNKWVIDNCDGDLAEVDVAKQVRGAAMSVAKDRARTGAGRQDGRGELELVRLSEIEMKPVVFVDRPLWQAHAFTLLTGRKGVGKGTAIADLAARMSRGELGPKRDVIWLASEDSTSVDVKPRFVVAQGDESHIYILKTWIELPRDVEALGEAIAIAGDVGLVILDPIGNHIGGKDTSRDGEIRNAIAQLNRLADEHETLVLGVRHITEKEAKNGAVAAIMGSSAWVQLPRAVVAIARDDIDPTISHVQVVMGNRLPPGTPGHSFRIDGVQVPGLESEVTRAVWLGDSTKNIEELIASGSREGSKSEHARELILDTLEGEPELSMESDALDAKVAHETGLKARTVRNLRVDLNSQGLVKSVPERDEVGGEVKRWLVSAQPRRGADAPAWRRFP